MSKELGFLFMGYGFGMWTYQTVEDYIIGAALCLVGIGLIYHENKKGRKKK